MTVLPTVIHTGPVKPMLFGLRNANLMLVGHGNIWNIPYFWNVTCLLPLPLHVLTLPLPLRLRLGHLLRKGLPLQCGRGRCIVSVGIGNAEIDMLSCRFRFGALEWGRLDGHWYLTEPCSLDIGLT